MKNIGVWMLAIVMVIICSNRQKEHKVESAKEDGITPSEMQVVVDTCALENTYESAGRQIHTEKTIKY